MITKAYCHETFEKALPYVFKSRIERGGGWRGGIARGGCKNSQKIVSGGGELELSGECNF